MKPIQTLLLACMALGLAACSDADPSFALQSFKSCEKLEQAIKDQAIAEVRWQDSVIKDMLGFGFGFVNPFGGDDDFDDFNEMGVPGSVAMDVAFSGGGERAFSDTNIQVEGVDEADLVKSDGTHIFYLAADYLVVTKAWPVEEMAELGRLKIEGLAQGLYLDSASGHLAVLSQVYNEAGSPESELVVRNLDALLKLTVVDISDLSNPKNIRETYTDGLLYSSRRIGDMIYVVSYRDVQPSTVQNAEGRKDKVEAIEKTTLDDWMSMRFDSLRETDGTWSQKSEGTCDCTNVYTSERQAGYYMVSVQGLNLAQPDSEFIGSAVLGNLETVYMSDENLYLVSKEFEEGPFASFDGRVESVIHKFSLTESTAGTPSYKVSGKVPGWVVNSFSLDEYNGNLRVATTSQEMTVLDGGQPSAGVYVLEDTGNEMDIAGQVDGLAPGEEVTAVRFEEDAGYVATFEQVDPLFAIDLSDPGAPAVRGELHITGFSNYLHKLDDQYLLGIGQDLDEWGANSQGVQVSIFDVSDLTNPTLAHKEVLSGTSYSEAQSDHHAFNYFAEKSTLVVPAFLDSAATSRMYVLGADKSGLSQKGSISHSSMLKDEDSVEDYWAYSYCSDFRRSVIIEDIVFAVSNVGISAATIDAPETALNSVVFANIDPCGGRYGHQF